MDRDQDLCGDVRQAPPGWQALETMPGAAGSSAAFCTRRNSRLPPPLQTEGTENGRDPR